LEAVLLTAVPRDVRLLRSNVQAPDDVSHRMLRGPAAENATLVAAPGSPVAATLLQPASPATLQP